MEWSLGGGSLEVCLDRFLCLDFSSVVFKLYIIFLCSFLIDDTHTFKSKISSVRFLGICNFLNKTRLPAYFGLTAPLRPPLTVYCSSHPFLSHSCLPLFGGCSAGCVCSGAPSVGSGISTFLHSENVLTLLFSERRLGFV